MIKLLKNKEVLRTVLLETAAAAVATVIGFCVDRRAGFLIAALCLFFLIVHFVSTRCRYKKIAALAADINRMLHGDDTITLEDYSEGELGILHSEVHKMTIRLREQQQRLVKDKQYLADSIADISHQIRTPLTSVNLMLELLCDEKMEPGRRGQLIHELKSMLARIDWLITTLLKISRLDTGTVQFKVEKMTLEELVRRSCEPLLVQLELKEQELALNAKGEFCGDASWTGEAIGNIVKNCMEHTPRGGKIEIEASENALYTQILIMDNGPGIADEDMPRIFERFYKGKNSSDKGFGVGIALARMIITGQNGTIKAVNRPCGGAEFNIRFYKSIV